MLGPEPDAMIVDKFRGDGVLTDSAVPVATMQMLWFLDETGRPQFLSKFDGDMRLSITIGDLLSLVHVLQHQAMRDAGGDDG